MKREIGGRVYSNIVDDSWVYTGPIPPHHHHPPQQQHIPAYCIITLRSPHWDAGGGARSLATPQAFVRK
eukprot:2775800-Pyramimonas_sp.AAC.1